MRVLTPLMVWARARARAVLPVPGKSSRSTWPSLIAVASTSSTTLRLPRIACSTLSASSEKVSANQVACSGGIVIRCPLGGSGGASALGSVVVAHGAEWGERAGEGDVVLDVGEEDR